MSGNWVENQVLDFTVLSSSVVTTSNKHNIADFTKFGLIAPALTTGSITFQVSADGTSYFGAKGSDGTDLKVAAATGSAAFGDLPGLAPYNHVQLVTATQAAERTFKLICKS